MNEHFRPHFSDRVISVSYPSSLFPTEVGPKNYTTDYESSWAGQTIRCIMRVDYTRLPAPGECPSGCYAHPWVDDPKVRSDKSFLQLNKVALYCDPFNKVTSKLISKHTRDTLEYQLNVGDKIEVIGQLGEKYFGSDSLHPLLLSVLSLRVLEPNPENLRAAWEYLLKAGLLFLVALCFIVVIYFLRSGEHSVRWLLGLIINVVLAPFISFSMYYGTVLLLSFPGDLVLCCSCFLGGIPVYFLVLTFLPTISWIIYVISAASLAHNLYGTVALHYLEAYRQKSKFPIKELKIRNQRIVVPGLNDESSEGFEEKKKEKKEEKEEGEK